jgi:glycosyltransferase involved in cell wall biosynthesis
VANVLLNALASTAGGGLTYLRNVLPRLSRSENGHHYYVLAPPEQLENYQQFAGGCLQVETSSIAGGPLARMCWEQMWLRRFIKARQVDILISLGNFALFASPVPQLLFNRNALYFSPFFKADLWRRGCYRNLLSHKVKNCLARLSISQTQFNLTPTAAFAQEIKAAGLSHKEFSVLPFGFDSASFTANSEPLPETQLTKLNLAADCLRILYVSHYNYFRNFETLLRAWPLLKRAVCERTGRTVQLVLTTDLRRGASYGGYDATAAAELIEQLGVRADIAMLGSVPYDKLHQLYRLCEVFVCPSYAESFGHPLVEAMALGLPVVAADLPVHREICGAAAVYFEVFDERALAAQVAQVLTDERLSAKLRQSAIQQARRFSWDEHVAALARLIDACVQGGF